MTNKQTIIIVEITILNNDAFKMLCGITGMTPEKLQDQIFNNLVEERICSCDLEDVGSNLHQIGLSSGYDLDFLLRILFPDDEKFHVSREVRELMDSIWIINPNEF